MDNKRQTLNELETKASLASTKNALIGIDGFIDKIVHPVDQRNGPGKDYTPITLIEAFGARISSAAGKSANIELAPVVDKLGGNGPIMANAQLAQGLKVRYIGALGKNSVHPLFQDFAQATAAVSIADPGVTHAVEFTDGKIMFGSSTSLEQIDYAQIVDAVGLDTLKALFTESDCIGMVNWTMIPYLSDVFKDFLDQLLPQIPLNPERIFFFDLADPEKRSGEDLRELLGILQRFEHFGKVILGLNYREAQQIATLLDLPHTGKSAESLKALATEIREQLKLDTIAIHPTDCAACATDQGAFYVDGPYSKSPKITTGAGDHFNSGFVTARLIGLSPICALTLATATSGYYVRTARSPSLPQLIQFIQTW
ncbi:MAG: carbohydrate kinase family protein [Verrucomicrobiota bacterium]